MPMVDYFHLDVYPDRSEMNHELCEISEEEWNRREERSHMWESDGRMARREISVFDAMMAELSADKEIRAEKFRKTHDLCKKSKDDTPADRKRNKLNRLRKMYGDIFEDGREWYYENGKTGSKKSTEKDAEIFRNLRERSVENDARRDYITDPVEHNVGKTTLQKQIDRKYAELQKIKTDFCEKNFLHPAGDDYAVTAQFGFVVFYPNEFYQKKWELQELELKQKKAYQRKLDKGNKYLRKYVIDERGDL